MQFSAIDFYTWASSLNNDVLFCYGQGLGKQRKEIVEIISLHINDQFVSVKSIIRSVLQYAADFDIEVSAKTISSEINEIIKAKLVSVTVIDCQKCIKL